MNKSYEEVFFLFFGCFRLILVVLGVRMKHKELVLLGVTPKLVTIEHQIQTSEGCPHELLKCSSKSLVELLEGGAW